MAKISVKQGAGDDPRELVESIVEGQTFPFMASITHKAKKPLVVPSTGINEVIKPGESVSFKVKNFEQMWLVVTDSAALAKRYNSDAGDFVSIEVPDVVKATPTADVAESADPAVQPVDAPTVAQKPTSKAAKADAAASA